MKPLLIGIAGGSASGKTTIAQCLKEEFEQTRSVVIIREDDYYKDQSQKTMAERGERTTSTKLPNTPFRTVSVSGPSGRRPP